MGIFGTTKKRMTPQEAFDLLLEGTAKKAELNKAFEVIIPAPSTYISAGALVHMLGLRPDKEPYPEAYNIVMMAVSMSLSEDDEDGLYNVSRIIAKYPQFAKDIIEYAKSKNELVNLNYLAYAYRYGWGVDADSEKAMSYIKSAKELASSSTGFAAEGAEKLAAAMNA